MIPEVGNTTERLEDASEMVGESLGMLSLLAELNAAGLITDFKKALKIMMSLQSKHNTARQTCIGAIPSPETK